jgi:hypothetical protein
VTVTVDVTVGVALGSRSLTGVQPAASAASATSTSHLTPAP